MVFVCARKEGEVRFVSIMHSSYEGILDCTPEANVKFSIGWIGFE